MTQHPAKKTLIVIAGPTAIGKTAAAIELAQVLNTEIISADSRQFFKEMSIGTAKPSAEELAAAPHHFIDSHSITEDINVGSFEQQGLALLEELFKTHDSVVMVGGSGLYIKAICEGFDELPDIKASVRDLLNQELIENGIQYLQEKLKVADPVYYERVDLQNPQRLIRALEVFESTGRPYSTFRKADLKPRPFDMLKIALNMPRERLYDRINLRVDMMMNDGLLKEVESLLPYRSLNALNTVGYSELFDYLDGHGTLEQAVDLIKQHTRNFAKRQITWFKKDPGFHWLEPGKDLTGKIMDLLHPKS